MTNVAHVFSAWLETIAATEPNPPLSVDAPNTNAQGGKPPRRRPRIYVSLIDYPLTF